MTLDDYLDLWVMDTRISGTWHRLMEMVVQYGLFFGSHVPENPVIARVAIAHDVSLGSSITILVICSWTDIWMGAHASSDGEGMYETQK